LSNPEKPKYQQIVVELRKSITMGEYKEGAKLPSEADLVKRFSTSRLTVQRALKELQHQQLIERRAGSGTYVRRVERSATHVFGLLIPGLGETEIFEPICQGMARAGRAGAHALLWGDTTQTSGDKEKQTKELCEYYISRAVSGIFFAPLELTTAKDEVNSWIIESLEKARIPVILLDRCLLPYPRRSKFDLIGIDNRRAGFVVTEHLLRHGCRRPAFVAAPYSAPTVDARIAGLKAPATGQIELADGIVTGLRLRMGASGIKTYILRKRVQGKWLNVTIGRHGPSFTLANARRKAARSGETGRCGSRALSLIVAYWLQTAGAESA